LYQTRRGSLYGVLLPGVLGVSKTIRSAHGNRVLVGGASYLALDWGLGVELPLATRCVMHVEITGPMYGVRRVELGRSEPDAQNNVLVISSPPQVVTVTQLTAGASYRIRRSSPYGVEVPVDGRWELGVQVTRATMAGVSAGELRSRPALGLFASYRIARATYADTTINIFTDSTPALSAFDGGRLRQLLGGVKLGTRMDGYGLFAKMRLGLHSQSSTVQVAEPSRLTTGWYNALALDVGAVFERYVGRRLLVRFDGGDTVAFVRPTTIVIGGERQVVSSNPAHSLNMGFGVGWRF